MSDVEVEDPYAVSSDSEDEAAKKPPPKIAIEGRSGADFKQIKESLASERKSPSHDAKEAEKPTGLDHRTMSAFKEKFEHVGTADEGSLEDSLKEMVAGVGKENMSAFKDKFEHAEQAEGLKFASEQREEIGQLKRSEAEKKKRLAAFMEEEAKEPQRNCYICDTIVYPVERVVAAKNCYHNTCFKCSKCSKKLTRKAVTCSPTTFNSHEGALYCRAHYREALHPEQAGALLDADAEDEVEHEEDEFALVSKPKQLASDVLRASDTTNIGEELAQLRSLSAAKAELAASLVAGGDAAEGAEAAAAAVDERRSEVAALREHAAAVKSRWLAGDVEGAEAADASSAHDELEELRRGTRVAERFREGATADEALVKRIDAAADLDTAAAAAARRSFVEGSAFKSAPVEKTATDLDEIKSGSLSSQKERFESGAVGGEESAAKAGVQLNVELAAIKESLGKQAQDEEMMPEERANKKAKEIEEEFLRYKIARKLQEKRAQQTDSDGEQSAHDAAKEPRLDVELGMAGKARERFMAIDAQNPGAVAPTPHKSDSPPKKWDKKGEATAEVVNRRADADASSDEEDDAFDVKHLMNKFKNLQDAAPSKMDRNLDELEALRVEARQLRECFEQQQTAAAAGESEDKKRQLETEFKQLKQERERALRELEEERKQAEAEKGDDKEDVQIAADHASKMAAKWEKLNKKEAKKAEKSKMPQRT